MWASLYHPREWPALAEKLGGAYLALSNSTNSTETLKPRAPSRQIPRTPFTRHVNTNSSDPATDYAYHAIACSDAVDAGNSTTKQGFETVVDLTENYTRMCEYDS